MKDALVGNAASSKQVKKARKREKRIEAQRAFDRHEVMSTVAGRRYNWRLIGEGGLFDSPLRGGVEMVLFHVGQQDQARKLYAELVEHEPEFYLLMQQEAVHEQQQAAAEAAAAVAEQARRARSSDSEDEEDEEE